jgi:hypothetical protein
MTSALDGGEWSNSPPCRFTPGETENIIIIVLLLFLKFGKSQYFRFSFDVYVLCTWHNRSGYFYHVGSSVSWYRVVIFLLPTMKTVRHDLSVLKNMWTYIHADILLPRKPQYVYGFEETSILASVVSRQISPWSWKRTFQAPHVIPARHVTCEHLKPGRLHVLGLFVHIRKLS